MTETWREESVLDRPIGGPHVMHEQLDHLVELSARDNVEILVLPTALGRHDGLDGQFRVLHFAQAQPIGYVEYPDGAIYVQDQEQVAAYTRTAESLRSVALSKGRVGAPDRRPARRVHLSRAEAHHVPVRLAQVVVQRQQQRLRRGVRHLAQVQLQ